MLKIDYYTPHCPVGAYASYTCGRIGKRGGFGIALGRPASQNLVIAYRRGEQARALPWFEVPPEYQGVVAGAQTKGPPYLRFSVFQEGEIARQVKWATDTWTAGDLSFRLYTPFDRLPDPPGADPNRMALLLCPVLIAELAYDNRQSEVPARLYFGVAATGSHLRPLDDVLPGLAGVASGTQWGFAARAEAGRVQTSLSYEMTGFVDDGEPAVRRLSPDGGILFRVKPGEKAVFTLALGFYQGGIVTTGLETRFYYTRFFQNLEQVLAYGLAHADCYRELAARRDAELDSSGLSEERRWLVSQSTRTYYANTEVLDLGSQPVWIVNEGGYQMLNTLDLTIDHLFFEMMWHPWTVRNCLDLMADRYAYFAEVQDTEGGRGRHPGGISFAHDMGVLHQFSPPGVSAYENSNGCMCHEELCNWAICGSLYATLAPDAEWMRRRQGVFQECLKSLVNRDHWDPSRRDGVMDLDTVRMGPQGQEITTYDYCGRELIQARQNLYMAVKTWATYVCLAQVFQRLGLQAETQTAADQAQRAARTIAGHFREDEGYIPPLFHGDSTSHILPAIEGLIYPYVLGDLDAVSPEGRFGDLIAKLARHAHTCLQVGRCIDRDTGGLRISSTYFPTEQAKMQILQFVLERVLRLDLGEQVAGWDRIHVGWQQTGDARDWVPITALSRAHTGEAYGAGRWYPRAITSILFLWGQSGAGIGRSSK